MINTTETQSTSMSFLTVWPSGMTPLASNLNFDANETLPNLVNVGLSGGQVQIYNSQGTVHVIGDVAGYYETN